MKQHTPGLTIGSERPATPQPKPKGYVPDMELIVEVDGLRDPNQPKFLESPGTVGHAGRANSGGRSVLLVVEMKDESPIVKAQCQLPATYPFGMEALSRGL